MTIICKKRILLFTCVSLLLYSCNFRAQKKQSIISSSFKRLELYNTDGFSTSFRIAVDSNGQYEQSINRRGSNKGVLPDSLFKRLDIFINDIAVDSTIKTNYGLCCDCESLHLKIIRKSDTLDIIQYNADIGTEINWKINSKLNQMVVLLSHIPPNSIEK